MIRENSLFSYLIGKFLAFQISQQPCGILGCFETFWIIKLSFSSHRGVDFDLLTRLHCSKCDMEALFLLHNNASLTFFSWENVHDFTISTPKSLEKGGIVEKWRKTIDVKWHFMWLPWVDVQNLELPYKWGRNLRTL